MISLTKEVVRLTCLVWTLFFIGIFINPTVASANQVVVIPLVKNHITAIKPSEVVELGTTSLPANNVITDVLEITPAATSAGTYTVPPNKMLVITNITIFPQIPVAGTIRLQLVQNNSIRKYFVVSSAEPTQLNFGPGILFPEGYSLSIKNWTTSDSSIRVSLHGYETEAE